MGLRIREATRGWLTGDFVRIRYSKRGMAKMKRVTMAFAALLGLQGCSVPYMPQGKQQLVLTSESYFKDGTPHSRDLLRSNLGPLVEEKPTAYAYARAARRNQLAAR